MSSKPLTVKELRKAMEGLPDDAIVMVWGEEDALDEDMCSHAIITAAYTQEVDIGTSTETLIYPLMLCAEGWDGEDIAEEGDE